MKVSVRYAAYPHSEILCGDERFPARVKTALPKHKKLYIIGDLNLALPLVAIIGAREASPYGLKAASLVAQWAVEAGFTVVSGCARGCDQQAHRAALKAGGKTIAVLGCAADVVYPASASKLLTEIAEKGAIISSYEWGTPPQKYRFVERNRLIAALSEIIVVTEAKLPSGTFSTVEHALSLGVEVAAVPGSIFSALSCGSNRLIADGAYSISSEEDFRAALGLFTEGWAGQKETHETSPLLRALRAEACHPDDLARILRTPIDSLMTELLKLEIEGLVTRYRDGRFAILKK